MLRGLSFKELRFKELDFKKLSQKAHKVHNVLQPYQPRRQYVEAYDGFNIPVSIIGSGTPVLMVHAFGMDARQFLPFILPLANQFCFYLPHLRGWGLSADTPSTQFDFIEQYADDIEVLLSTICCKHDTDAIDVAAISMGALVMWAYFNRHSNQPTKHVSRSDDHLPLANPNKGHVQTHDSKVNTNKVRRYFNIDQSPIVHNQPDWKGGVFGDKQDKVFKQFSEVLQTTQPYIDRANPDNSDKRYSTVKPSKTNHFSHLPYSTKLKIIEMENLFSLMSVERRSSRWLSQASGYQPSYKLALYEHKTWQQKLHGLQAYLALPYDYRTALTITLPVTMLIGGKSQLYDPVWQRKVADILPNAKVVEVAESGHAIPMDAPIRFIRELKQFLTS